MDPKTLIVDIYQLAKAGEFCKILPLINHGKLDEGNYLNILIWISNGCYHNMEKCHLDSLEELTNTVISYINTSDLDNLTKYVQSIFHITKLLCKEERFKDLAKMEIAIIPTFLKSLNLKHIPVAEHAHCMTIRQISQAIGQLAQAKNKAYNKYVLDIIKILLRAQNELGNLKQLMVLAKTSCNVLLHLDATNDELFTFYEVLLEIIAIKYAKSQECAHDVQILIIQFFSCVISEIFRSRDCEFAIVFLDTVVAIISQQFKKPQYVQSHLMFKAITALVPIKEHLMQENIDNAKLVLNTFKTSYKKLFDNIAYFLEEPLLQLLSFYKEEGSNIWCQLPDTVIVDILKFLMKDVIHYLMLSPKPCNCGCSIGKNYRGILKIGYEVAALLHLYVENSKNISKEFFSQVGKWMCFFYIIIKKLKDAHCMKWSTYYNNMTCYAFNITRSLHEAEHTDYEGIVFYYLKSCLELEGLQPKIKSMQHITFAFAALCKVQFKKKNWVACSVFAALYCLLFVEGRNNIFQNWWIKVKLEAKNDTEFQRQTLVSVLDDQAEQFANFFNFRSLLTADKKLELLKFELHRYRSVWSSKLSMMVVFEEINKIADLPTIAETIMDVYCDESVPVHIDLYKTFLSISTNMEREILTAKGPSDPKLRLALAVLRFHQFKSAMKANADINLREMEKTMQVLDSEKDSKPIEAVPKDANDECDIVSVYSSLRLNKFTEVLAPLNDCADLLGALIDHPFEPDILKSISKLLVNIAFEYRVHDCTVKSLQIFEMCRRHSQMIVDKAGHLFALGFLIESADVNKNSVQELIAEGDELATWLENENEKTESISSSLATYYLNKSKAFLHDDSERSYEAWRKADALCTANEEKRPFQLVRAQLLVVLQKLTRRCDFIEGEHQRQPMTFKLHVAYDRAVEMLHTYGGGTAQELSVILDIIYELPKAYSLMRLPRDLRAYSKSTVLFTQKLALPLRCLSFLLLLAHSDLTTGQLDHCTEKLNGIDDILNLSHVGFLPVPRELESGAEHDTEKLEDDIDRCTSLIQDLLLNTTEHTKQYSPASPLLTVRGFKFPQFMSHEKACTCFKCISLEFQRFLLDKYHLNALVHMYERDEKIAEEFVVGALALHEAFRRNYDSYKAKTAKLIPEYLIPDFEDSFREPYAHILYDYSFHMSRKARKAQALKINLELLQILKPRKMQYVYLYHDALLQRLGYMVPDRQKKLRVERDLELNKETSEGASFAKTPAGKTTAVTVMVNGVPDYTPPPRLKGKRCNLFGGPKGGEQAKQLPPRKTKNNEELGAFTIPKAKSKKGPVATPVASIPFLGTMGTPTIKIFMDSEPTSKSLKTYSRKRLASAKKSTQLEPEVKNGEASQVLVELTGAQHLPVISGSTRKKTRGQVLAQKIKESSVQNASSLLKKDTIEDKSPASKENVPAIPSEEVDDSSVICASPEHAVATAKTKMLLDKIKSSAKKPGRPKRAVSELKKNLLSEFEETETAGNNATATRNTGAIRKSTRNRIL